MTEENLRDQNTNLKSENFSLKQLIEKIKNILQGILFWAKISLHAVMLLLVLGQFGWVPMAAFFVWILMIEWISYKHDELARMSVETWIRA